MTLHGRLGQCARSSWAGLRGARFLPPQESLDPRIPLPLASLGERQRQHQISRVSGRAFFACIDTRRRGIQRQAQPVGLRKAFGNQGCTCARLVCHVPGLRPHYQPGRWTRRRPGRCTQSGQRRLNRRCVVGCLEHPAPQRITRIAVADHEILDTHVGQLPVGPDQTPDHLVEPLAEQG